MKNKPSKSPRLVNWFVGVSVRFTDHSASTIEKLIFTLQRLDLASSYYEDYFCSDDEDWWELLKNVGNKQLSNKVFNNIRKNYRYRPKRNPLTARELIILGRRTQSHQLVQALELVQRIGKYPYPSSYLIDSS